MRNEIINLIENTKNTNQFFLTGDLGFSVLENLEKKLKNNFVNVGVSENNMFLMACGITIEKKNLVYLYSISPFLILRNLEIIRNYISNDNRNIRLIGVGSGVSYTTMGKTHFNLDDLNVIYSLKNILILNPANIFELKYLFKKFRNYKRPIYFRINKNSYNIYKKFKRKKNLFVKKGSGKNIITSGAILNFLLKFYDDRDIDKMNIISVPILDSKYNKSILNFLNKDDTILLVDSSKFLYFQEIQNEINCRNKNFFCLNFDFDHNKIKGVGNEEEILGEMGFNKLFLDKFFFKN